MALVLDHGVAVVTRGRDPQSNHIWSVQGGDLTGGIPIVVLVDGRTASAAEIMAAALADHGRAVVVGSATLGKGLVQTIAQLPDGGELFVTWSRVMAPLGWPLQGLGVMPQLCTSLGQAASTARSPTWPWACRTMPGRSASRGGHGRRCRWRASWRYATPVRRRSAGMPTSTRRVRCWTTPGS